MKYLKMLRQFDKTGQAFWLGCLVDLGYVTKAEAGRIVCVLGLEC